MAPSRNKLPPVAFALPSQRVVAMRGTAEIDGLQRNERRCDAVYEKRPQKHRGRLIGAQLEQTNVLSVGVLLFKGR